MGFFKNIIDFLVGRSPNQAGSGAIELDPWEKYRNEIKKKYDIGLSANPSVVPSTTGIKPSTSIYQGTTGAPLPQKEYSSSNGGTMSPGTINSPITIVDAPKKKVRRTAKRTPKPVTK